MVALEIVGGKEQEDPACALPANPRGLRRIGGARRQQFTTTTRGLTRTHRLAPPSGVSSTSTTSSLPVNQAIASS